MTITERHAAGYALVEPVSVSNIIANWLAVATFWPHFPPRNQGRSRTDRRTRPASWPLACPSIRCTTFGLAPAWMARLAAVWRSAWAVTRGKVGSATWHRVTARASHEVTAEGGPRYPPARDGHSMSSRSLPAQVTASASVTNPGTTTVRFLLPFRVPTTTVVPTMTALRCKVIRRRRKSMSHTRNAEASPHRNPPTPRSNTSDRYRPDSSASRSSCAAVKYTFVRGVRFGSFTPRAGFDASIRSRTASSRIRANTECAVTTTAPPRFAAMPDTHACTSENRTSAMRTFPQRGHTCTRHAES